MTRNTAIVGAPLRRYITLAGAPTWRIPPFKARQAEAPDEDDVYMAEWMEDQLDNLATPLPTVVMAGAMSRWNGCTIQVWRARRTPDGMVGLADLVDRPMHTIERWTLDDDGTVLGVVQRGPDGKEYVIDRARMVWSRDIPLTDSPAGVGIFRQLAEAVRELEALFKMLHQGLETDLGGIPIVYAPIEELKARISETIGNGQFTQDDFTNAIRRLVSFVQNHVRTKETGLVFDSGPVTVNGVATSMPRYKVELLQAGGQSFGSILEAIKQKLWEIAIVTGFEYLLLGADGSGSLAMAQIKTADAYRLVSSFLNAYAVTLQRDVFRPFWALNGRDPMRAPRPVWNRKEFEAAVSGAATLLGALAGAGVTVDRTDALVREVVTDAGYSPLEARDEDEVLGPVDERTANRYGLGGKPDEGDKGEVDAEDGDDLEDDDTDEPPAAPAKKGR